MKIRTIKYYFYEGFRSVFKNGIMSLASSATVASCIFILAITYCLASNLGFALKQIEDSVGVSVIIDDKLTTDQVNQLYETIVAMESIDSVVYISAEDALQKFSDQLGDSAGILKGLENDNPLPRSFDITIRGVENQKDVINQLDKLKNNEMGITNINHAKDTIDVLMAVNNGIRIISLAVILSLGTLSVVIITNTIRLTVNNRKNEITIMKYVGATDWFIKFPFIVEGMIIGLLGALFPIIICYIGYDQVVFAISDKISVVKTIFEFQPKNEIFLLLAPVALGIGLLLGTIGSSTSVRRYLNV